jgi:hypothetical protein
MSVSAQTALHFLMNHIGAMLGTKFIEDAHSERPRALTRDELVEMEEGLQQTLQTVTQAREAIPHWQRLDCYECGRHAEYLVSDADNRSSSPFGSLPAICYQCWSLSHPEDRSRWVGFTRYPYYEPLERHYRQRRMREFYETDGEESSP